MFRPPSLALILLVSAWLPFLFCDENLEEMDKKAAVDCKTIKKTNARTMNFTEKGKEYVCKQLIEKEHKLFTFFKVPSDDDDSDNPLSSNVCLKQYPDIKSKGKNCFVVCVDPNATGVRNNMSSLNNGSVTRSGPEKLEGLEIHQNITHKSSKKIPKKNPHQTIARKSVRGQFTTAKSAAPFQLSFPAWLKIPSLASSEPESLLKDSEDQASDLNDFDSFTELFPSDFNVHKESRIVRKHKTNIKPTSKSLVSSYTMEELFPMKNIGTIPTKIEVTTVLDVPLVGSHYTEGALNNIPLNYDETGLESLRRTAINDHDEENRVNPETTLVYSDSANLNSNTKLNQIRKENL